MTNFKSITASLLFLLTSQFVNGQAMLSDGGGMIFINKNIAQEESLEGKRGAYFGTHPLGDEIQLKYDNFQKRYIKYESSGGAYATEKRVIYKRPIYSSINKIDKYFKKAHKKKSMNLDEIVKRYSHVLDVANEIRFYNTTQFEALMSTAKSEEQMIQYYESITFDEE